LRAKGRTTEGLGLVAALDKKEWWGYLPNKTFKNELSKKEYILKG
jgi:hypothetical protein